MATNAQAVFQRNALKQPMKVLAILAVLWLLSGVTAAFLSFGPTLLRMLLFGPISLANWI